MRSSTHAKKPLAPSLAKVSKAHAHVMTLQGWALTQTRQCYELDSALLAIGRNTFRAGASVVGLIRWHCFIQAKEVGKRQSRHESLFHMVQESPAQLGYDLTIWSRYASRVLET